MILNLQFAKKKLAEVVHSHAYEANVQTMLVLVYQEQHLFGIMQIATEAKIKQSFY